MRAWIYLLIGLTLSFALLWLVIMRHQLNFEAVWAYRSLFFKGWLNTIWISCASLMLSLLFGFITALMQRSHLRPVTMCSRIYIEIIRGTPLLVQTLFFFYVVRMRSDWKIAISPVCWYFLSSMAPTY